MSFTLGAATMGALMYTGCSRILSKYFETPASKYTRTNPTVTLEILVTHLAHASTLDTKAQFCTWFLTFASAAYKGAMFKEIVRLITELSEMPDPTTNEVQAGEDDVRDIAAECEEFMARYPKGCCSFEGLTEESLLDDVDMEVQSSWDDAHKKFGFGVDCFKAVRHAPFYRHGRKIIATCLAGSLFSERLAADHKWFHKRLFDGVDHKGNMDPVDLLDEVVDLMRVVVDAATFCAQTGSVMPLLGRGKEAYALDLEHAFLRSRHEYYIVGSLSNFTTHDGLVVTDSAYVCRVEQFLARIKRLHAGSDGVERRVLQQRVADAMKWDADVKERLSRASVRAEPFTILLLGPTAQGKTAQGMAIMRHTLQMNGFPHKQENVASVDSNSNFMDTVQNSTQGVFMDDVANTKPLYAKTDAMYQFIQLRNSSVVPVAKAGLDEKGRVFHNSKVVILSTNVPDLNANETSNEPSAVMRRFNIVVRVTVRPEFATVADSTNCLGLEGRETLPMIDPAKMVDGIYSSHQYFDVLKWQPFARTQAEPKDTGGLFLVVHKRKVMHKLNYSELMLYIKEISAQHFERQNRIITATKEDEEQPLCRHGHVTARFCREGCAPVPHRPQEEEILVPDQSPPSPIEVQAGDFLTNVFFPETEASRLVEPEFPPVPSPEAPLSSVSSLDVGPPSSSSEAGSLSSSSDPFQIYDADLAPDLLIPWRVRARCRLRVLRMRVRARWDALTTTPVVEEPPQFIGLCKAWSHGRFDIERLAYTHFDGVMLAVLSIAPGVACVCSSLLSLVGFGAFAVSASWLSCFVYVGLTVSRTTRGWIAGRVTGATLKELKSRVREASIKSLFAIGVIMSTLMLFQGMRRLLRPAKKENKPKASLPVTDAVFEPKCVADIDYDDADDDVPPELAPLEFQGGCVSGELPATGVRDPIPKTNAWERRAVDVWYRTEGAVRNMTEEQIYAKAEKQLYVMTICYTSGARVASNALVVATNYIVAPAHNFITPKGEWSAIECMYLQSTTALRGPVFKVKLSPMQMLRLQGDVMLVQVNAGGTMPDVLDLIGLDLPRVAFPAVELYRVPEDCAVQRTRYLVTPAPHYCAQYNIPYWGCSGTRPAETFKGLCGALILTGARYPQIVGFHTMGNGHRAVSCCFTREAVRLGIAELSKTALLKGPVIVQPDTTPFTPAGLEAAGELGPLALHSVLREVEPGTAFKPLGTLTNYQQVRAKTRLEVSPLSPLVEEVCGEARVHEPPRTIGKATVEVLKLREMAERNDLRPQHLRLAAQDTYDEMAALVESTECHAMLTPVSLDEATSGRAHCHTIRGINRSTAAGWPHTGSKHPFVYDNPRDGLPDAFSLTPEVVADVQRAMASMEKGERPNMVFKGSHKDEAVKIGKLKTRVFEGSPLIFTIITRQLFIPIIRLYLLARHITGSAVGIDASSLEWDDLCRHMMEYNGECAIVGDWKHFDTSQTYQEMMTMFGVWIALLERYGNYTAEQITACWVVAEETCRHYTLLRGDLGITEGTTASGGALTVYLNSPVGELRFKSAFYGMAMEQGEVGDVPLWDLTQHKFTTGGLSIKRNGRAAFKPLLPNLKGRFADHVRGSYYGDDFIQAARVQVLGWYNQQSLCAYYAREGLTLTDAAKKPFEAPTTPWSEVTFLKRSFRLDAELGAYMGTLELASIYKSLHVWPAKRQWGDAMHAAQIFSGALRELMLHGRKVYEERAPRLLAVAERFGSAGYILPADRSYDAMKSMWVGREICAQTTFLEHTAPSE